jgi:hypothetical protein
MPQTWASQDSAPKQKKKDADKPKAKQAARYFFAS